MATSSEQQQRMLGFPFYSMGKRKLDSNETPLSMTYENGVFRPKNEKRQRFNSEYEELQTTFPNGFIEQNTAVNCEAQHEVRCHETSENMNTDTDMVEADTTSTINMEEESSENYTNGITSEDTKQNPGSNTSASVGFPRSRPFGCTAPLVRSYCFESGLIDNMLINYHGL